MGNPTLSEVKENFTSKIFNVTSTHKNGVKENLIDLISTKEGGRAEGGHTKRHGSWGIHSMQCSTHFIQ